jgi:hypothetical protein
MLRLCGQRLQQRRIVENLGDELFRTGLAVHVRDQVRQLRPRLEQLVERVDLARDGGRREVVHALEGDVHLHVAFARQRVRHAEGHARLHGLHPVVEVVHVDVEELALVDAGQRLLGIATQVGHDAHDERHLDLLLGAVQLDVVLDLHTRRAIARDELLTALLCHGLSS